MSMTKITEVTVGAGGAASIDFTNIPQTFTDLMVVVSVRGDRSATFTSSFMKLNTSTANFTLRYLTGNGSSAGSGSDSLGYYGYVPCANATSNTFASTVFYIPNYAGSTYKSISVDDVSETNATTAYFKMDALLWSQTAAVTGFSIYLDTSNFVQYSTATLYGVSKVPLAGDQPKATGGDIYQNGSYTYHVFKTSGTFTPTTAISNAEMLIVAGGAGGGRGDNGGGGGGGAGGVLNLSSQSMSATPYTVTVGGGGGQSTSGSNSSIAGFTAATGGNAGGGGAGGAGGASGNGFAGGGGGNYSGGGGGGASSAGSGYNSSNSYPGPGGLATSAYSAWTQATNTGYNGAFSGGGGGGSYWGTVAQAAGGGASAGAGGYYNITAGSASANTGSGGGGNDRISSAGSGGSGVVIIRYA